MAVDSAGNNDGLLQGNPTWLPEGGIIDGALALDGLGDYVRVETVGISGQAPRTIAGWVRATTTNVPDWTNVFGFTGPSGEGGHFDIEVVGQTGTTTAGHYGVHVYGWQQNLLPIDREWHHFAATYDGAEAAWYADGTMLGSEAVSVSTETTIQMGKRIDNDNFFSGQIDDVRVYDEALSSDQIQVVMIATPTIDWHRAIYWDARYPTNWVQSHSVQAALGSAGYEVLNADQLKTWMDARIADGAYSVVVFCQDVAPETVFETATSTCTLRRYLDAGGKIVWYGDIPLYYQGHSDGTMTTFDLDGSLGALGFRAAGGIWEIGEQVTLTDEGRAWGLTHTWPSVRPAEVGDLRVLARDSSGLAAAWVQHYFPGDTFTGFVRFSDSAATPNAEDIQRLAEYPNAVTTRQPNIIVGDRENMLTNGGFEDGVIDPWNTYGDVTTEVVTQLDGAAIAEAPVEGVACLHIVVPHAGVNFWDAGLQHRDHIFEAGKKYTLSVFLKSKSGTVDINLKPELGASPWTDFGSQVVTIFEEWAEYSVTTPVMTADVDPAAITFHIAFAPGDFWVDGARWYEGNYVPPGF